MNSEELPVNCSLGLDLGSGPRPALGYTGVDYGVEAADPEHVVIHHDLWSGEPWPFEDGSIHRLRAWHVIEHIPHERITTRETRTAKVYKKFPGQPVQKTTVALRLTQDAFFWFFDEAFRIAAPGCVFELAWPHPWHEHADQDPTHCRRIPESTLFYLNAHGRRTLAVTQYPVACDWQIESVVKLTSRDLGLGSWGLGGKPEEGPGPDQHVGIWHELRATLSKPVKPVDPFDDTSKWKNV